MGENALVPIAPSIPAVVPIPPANTVTQTIIPKRNPTMPKPKWHPPWKLYRVISGHLGWVRCVAVEPGNEWFATGSADRVIKVIILYNENDTQHYTYSSIEIHSIIFKICDFFTFHKKNIPDCNSPKN